MPVPKEVDKTESRREEEDELINKLLSGSLVSISGTTQSEISTHEVQERLLAAGRDSLSQNNQSNNNNNNENNKPGLVAEQTSVFSSPLRPRVSAHDSATAAHTHLSKMMLGSFAALGATDSSLMPLDMAVEHEKTKRLADEALARAVEISEQKRRHHNPRANAEAQQRRDLDFYERYEKLHQQHEEVEQIKKDIASNKYHSNLDIIQAILGKNDDDDKKVVLGDRDTYDAVQGLLSNLVIHRAKKSSSSAADGGVGVGAGVEVDNLKRKVNEQRGSIDDLRKKNRELTAALRIAAMETRSSQELLADRNDEIHRLRATINTFQLQLKNLKSREDLRKSLNGPSGAGHHAGNATSTLMREMDQLRGDYQHIVEQNLILEKEVRMLRTNTRGGGKPLHPHQQQQQQGSLNSRQGTSDAKGNGGVGGVKITTYQSQALNSAKRVAIRERFEAQERSLMILHDMDSNRLDVISKRMKSVSGESPGHNSSMGHSEGAHLRSFDTSRLGMSSRTTPQLALDPNTPPSATAAAAAAAASTSSSSPLHQTPKKEEKPPSSSPAKHDLIKQTHETGVFDSSTAASSGGGSKFASSGKSSRAWNALRSRLVRIVALGRSDLLRREEIHINKMRGKVQHLASELSAVTAERDILLEKCELLLSRDGGGGGTSSSLGREPSALFRSQSVRMLPGNRSMRFASHSDGTSALEHSLKKDQSNSNMFDYVDPKADLDMEKLRKELYELKHALKRSSSSNNSGSGGGGGSGDDLDADKPLDALFDILHSRVKHLEGQVAQRDAQLEQLRESFAHLTRQGGGGGSTSAFGDDPERIAVLQESLQLKALEKQLFKKEAEIVALDKTVRERESRLRATENQLAQKRAVHDLGLSPKSAARVVPTMRKWYEKAKGGVDLKRHEIQLGNRLNNKFFRRGSQSGVELPPGFEIDEGEEVTEEQEMLLHLYNMMEDPKEQKIIQDLLIKSKKGNNKNNNNNNNNNQEGEEDGEEGEKQQEGEDLGWSLSQAVEDSSALEHTSRRAVARRAPLVGGAGGKGKLSEIASESNSDRRWFVMRRTFLRLITVREEAWRTANSLRAKEKASAAVTELYSSLMQLEQKERSKNRPSFCVDAALATVQFATAPLLVSQTSRLEDLDREYYALRNLVETRATHERQLQSERDQAFAELHRLTRENSEKEQSEIAKTVEEAGALSIVHHVQNGETAASIGSCYGISDFGTLQKIATKSFSSAVPPSSASNSNSSFSTPKSKSSVSSATAAAGGGGGGGGGGQHEGELSTASSKNLLQVSDFEVTPGEPVWLPVLSFGVLQTLGDDFFAPKQRFASDVQMFDSELEREIQRMRDEEDYEKELSSNTRSSTLLVLRHHVQPNETIHSIATSLGTVDNAVMQACTLRPLTHTWRKKQKLLHPGSYSNSSSNSSTGGEEVPVVDVVISRKTGFHILQQQWKNRSKTDQVLLAAAAAANSASDSSSPSSSSPSSGEASSGTFGLGGGGGGFQQDRIFARVALPRNAHITTQLFARQYNVDMSWVSLLNMKLAPGSVIRLPFKFNHTFVSLLPQLAKRGMLEVNHMPGAKKAGTIKQVAEMYGATEEEVASRVRGYEKKVSPIKKSPKQQEGGDGGEENEGSENLEASGKYEQEEEANYNNQQQHQADIEIAASTPLYIPVRDLNAILTLTTEPETKQNVIDVMKLASQEEEQQNRELKEIEDAARSNNFDRPGSTGNSNSSSPSIAAITNTRRLRATGATLRLIDRAAVDEITLPASSGSASGTSSPAKTMTSAQIGDVPGVASLFDPERHAIMKSESSLSGSQAYDTTTSSASFSSFPSSSGEENENNKVDREEESLNSNNQQETPSSSSSSSSPPQKVKKSKDRVLRVAQTKSESLLDAAKKMNKLREDIYIPNAALIAEKLAAASASSASNELNHIEVQIAVQLDNDQAIDIGLNRLEAGMVVGGSGGSAAGLLGMHAVVPLDGSRQLKQVAQSHLLSMEDLRHSNPELNLGDATASPAGRIRVPISNESDVSILRLSTGEFYAVELLRIDRNEIANPNLLDAISAIYGISESDAKSKLSIFDAPLSAASTPYLHVRAENIVHPSAQMVPSQLSQPTLASASTPSSPSSSSSSASPLVAIDTLTGQVSFTILLPHVLARLVTSAMIDDNTRIRRSIERDVAEGLSDCFAAKNSYSSSSSSTSSSSPSVSNSSGIHRISVREVRDRNDSVEICLTARTKRIAFQIKKYISANWLSGYRGSESPMQHTVKLLHMECAAVREVAQEDVDMLQLSQIRDLRVRSVDLKPSLRIVRKGDTFKSLAITCGIGIEALLSANPEAVQSLLTPSYEADRRPLSHEKLLVPKPDSNPIQSIQRIEIQAGDSLVDVATRQASNLRLLKKINIAVLPLFDLVHVVRIPEVESASASASASSSSGGGKNWKDPVRCESTTVRSTVDGDSFVGVALRFGADVDELFISQDDLYIPKKASLRIPPSAGGLQGIEESSQEIPFTNKCTDIVADETDTLRSLAKTYFVPSREIALYNSSIIRVRRGGFITIITHSSSSSSSSSENHGSSSSSSSSPTAVSSGGRRRQPDIDLNAVSLDLVQGGRNSGNKKLLKMTSGGDLILNYPVRPNDTVATISNQFNTAVTTLIDLNPQIGNMSSASSAAALSVLVPVAQEDVNDVLVSQPAHLFAIVPRVKSDETLQIACKKYSAPFARANDANLMLPEEVRADNFLVPVASNTSAALCRQMGHSLYFMLQPNPGESMTRMAERCVGSARSVEQLIPIGKPLGSLGISHIQVPLTREAGKELLSSGNALLVSRDDFSNTPQVVDSLPEVGESLRITQTAFIEARERALEHKKTALEERTKELDRLLQQATSRIDATEREFEAVQKLRDSKIDELTKNLKEEASIHDESSATSAASGPTTVVTKRKFALFLTGMGGKTASGAGGGGGMHGNNAASQTDPISINLSELSRPNSKLHFVFSNSAASGPSGGGVGVGAGGLEVGEGRNTVACQTIALAAYQSTNVAEQQAQVRHKLHDAENEIESLQQQLDKAISQLTALKSKTPSPNSSRFTVSRLSGNSQQDGGHESYNSENETPEEKKKRREAALHETSAELAALQLELQAKEDHILALVDENSSLHTTLAEAFESGAADFSGAGGGSPGRSKRHFALTSKRKLIMLKSRTSHVKRSCTELKALVIRLFGGAIDNLQENAAKAGTELTDVDFEKMGASTSAALSNSSFGGGAASAAAGGGGVVAGRLRKDDWRVRDSEAAAVSRLVQAQDDIIAPLGRSRSMPCMRHIFFDGENNKTGRGNILDAPLSSLKKPEDWAMRQLHDYVVGQVSSLPGSGGIAPSQHYGKPSTKPTLETGSPEKISGTSLQSNNSGEKGKGKTTTTKKDIEAQLQNDLNLLQQQVGGGKKKPVGKIAKRPVHNFLKDNKTALSNASKSKLHGFFVRSNLEPVVPPPPPTVSEDQNNNNNNNNNIDHDDDDNNLLSDHQDITNSATATAAAASGMSPQRRLFEQMREDPEMLEKRRKRQEQLKHFVPMMQMIQALQGGKKYSTKGKEDGGGGVVDNDEEESYAPLTEEQRKHIEQTREHDQELHKETLAIAWRQLGVKLQIQKAKLKMEDLSMTGRDRRSMNNLVGLWRLWMAKWNSRRKMIVMARRSNIENLVNRFVMTQQKQLQADFTGHDPYSTGFSRRVLSPHKPTSANLIVTGFQNPNSTSHYPNNNYNSSSPSASALIGVGVGGGGRAAGGPMFQTIHSSQNQQHVVSERKPSPSPPSARYRHFHHTNLQPLIAPSTNTTISTTPLPPPAKGQKSSSHFQRVHFPNDDNDQS